nr:MAG TPA: hypothetical protein [Caudoviricetes sp.]
MHLFETGPGRADDWVEVTTFHSLNWTERAYDYGEFELIVFSHSAISPVSVWNYLVRDDTSTVMVVETVSTKQEGKTAYRHKITGRSLESMYDWRVTKHRHMIQPDSNGMFRAQTMAEKLAHDNFGHSAEASRRIDRFNFYRNEAVSDFAFVNDTGRTWQDNKWVTYDRCPVGEIMRDVLSAAKPNGYKLFWQVEWDKTDTYRTFIRAPRKVETVVLAEDNDNFTEFEAIKSNVDQKSVIYEIFDTGDFDYSWPANNTTQTIEHILRSEENIYRREVIWDNTSIHKPYAVDDWNRLSNEQKNMINKLSAGFFPFWALDHMFPKYTPLEMFSGRIQNLSGVEYRKGFRIGDVFEYVPFSYKESKNEIKRNTVREVQLTEMTESWGPGGFAQTPVISVSSRNKWNGAGFTLGFTRNDPGSVIVPRDKEK